MAAPRIVQEHKSVSHSWRTQAHEGAVECVKVKVVEASGALEPLVRIYTGGRDSSIRIWSAKGKLIKELSGHTAAVTALQVSKDMVRRRCCSLPSAARVSSLRLVAYKMLTTRRAHV